VDHLQYRSGEVYVLRRGNSAGARGFAVPRRKGRPSTIAPPFQGRPMPRGDSITVFGPS
jgi:hypothetical protein